MEKQNVYVGTDWLLYLEQVLTETQSKKPMLVCGKHILNQKELTDFIRKSRYQFTVFTDFQPNPEYSSTINAAKVFEKQRCDFMLAIGGGSAIDTAKCARRFAGMDLSQDCLVQAPKDSRIKLLAIPTTAGSGSEATRFAVLYRNNQKYSVSGDDMLPDYVILDPELLYDLPDYHKKSCFLDALCQAIESWWSLKANEESIAYSKKAIALLMKNYKKYFSLNANGSNKNEKDCATSKTIFTDVLLGAHYAGKAINITTTTAAHAMSYGLTKKFGLAHGHAVALCMIQVWQNLLKCYQNPDLVLKEISKAFGCDTQEGALEKFKLMLNDLQLSAPHGISKNDIQQLAETVNIQRLGNHPVQLQYKDMYVLYESIFRQNQMKGNL